MIELKVKWADGMHSYFPLEGQSLESVCSVAENSVYKGGAEYAAVYKDGVIYVEYES